MALDSKNPQKIIVGVLGLPINKKGEFLLTRRHAPGVKAWHNKWQVPGGGLEFGETPEQTLAREMKEELDVSVRLLHPHPIVRTSIWYGDETETKQDTQIVLITYLVDIGNQKVDVSNDYETGKYDWFTLAKATKLDSLPLTTDFVKAAAKITSNL